MCSTGCSARFRSTCASSRGRWCPRSRCWCCGNSASSSPGAMRPGPQTLPPSRNEVIDMALGVHSEVGRLRRVMVHRPGLEHTRLTPSNAGDLLFDDVIWVARAKQEHDMFVEVMRERGVEVFLAEKLLAEALAKPEAKEWVCSHILSERQVGVMASRTGREWVDTAEPATLAEFLIGGITKADVRQPAGLAWE